MSLVRTEMRYALSLEDRQLLAPSYSLDEYIEYDHVKQARMPLLGFVLLKMILEFS
jgi:hypothetical protein